MISQLFQAIMLAKCVLSILELNWNQRFRDTKAKLKIYRQVLTSSTELKKHVISRRRKNENVFKMSKNEKCTCKACKTTVFDCQICKFVTFLLLSSPWLLKLPIRSDEGLTLLVHLISTLILGFLVSFPTDAAPQFFY